MNFLQLMELSPTQSPCEARNNCHSVVVMSSETWVRDQQVLAWPLKGYQYMDLFIQLQFISYFPIYIISRRYFLF